MDFLTPLQALFRRELPAVLVEPDGRQRGAGPRPGAVLAGAFNPLHEGHLELAQIAARFLNIEVAFEVCVCNVDKPPLTPQEVSARLRPFSWRFPVWVTRMPTFADKAGLFPGTVFVVGADTAERVLAPRYYPGGAEGRTRALTTIRTRGCRFLVAGRRDARGVFVGVADLDIVPAFHDLFQEIPASDFRRDISSTLLRQRQSQSATDE